MHCCQCVISINATFIKPQVPFDSLFTVRKRSPSSQIDYFTRHVCITCSFKGVILYIGLFIGDKSHAVLISKNGLILHQLERQVRKIFFWTQSNVNEPQKFLRWKSFFLFIHASHAWNTFYSVALYAIVDNICAIDSKAISIFVIALFRAPQAVSFNTMSMW